MRWKMRSVMIHMVVAIVLLFIYGRDIGLPGIDKWRIAGVKAQQLPTPLSPEVDQPIMSEEEMRQWKTYADKNITFRYPARLVLRQRNGRIFLTHSARFKHEDPCDYTSDSRPLSRLIDFKVSLEIVNGDGNSEMPITDRKVKVGMLDGEFFPYQSEGCGDYKYKFPIGENKTLIVKRDIIGIFSLGAQRFGDDKRARKRTDIINSDLEQRFFYSILSTVKIRRADQLK